MLAKINAILAGHPMTIAAGIFLVLELMANSSAQNGFVGAVRMLPFSPAWISVVICGIPLLYLALWRVVHNPGISKISSALLISIAMAAAIAIGDLFAAGEVAFIMSIGALLEEATTNRAKKD